MVSSIGALTPPARSGRRSGCTQEMRRDQLHLLGARREAGEPTERAGDQPVHQAVAGRPPERRTRPPAQPPVRAEALLGALARVDQPADDALGCVVRPDVEIQPGEGFCGRHSATVPDESLHRVVRRAGVPPRRHCPWVWLSSGLFLRVQLANMALRLEKSRSIRTTLPHPGQTSEPPG
jgi:hypothetical protein